MKVVGIQQASLEDCVRKAQRERVVLTTKGKPVALLVGVSGLDWEQIELGDSDEFWTRIRERRGQKTINREALQKRMTNRKRRALGP